MGLKKFLEIGKKKKKVIIKDVIIEGMVYEVCTDGEFIDSKDSAIITFYKDKNRVSLTLRRKVASSGII